MGVGPQRHLLDAPQELDEGGVARQVAAQDERVDEEPDERLDLAPVAVGDRRADHDVLVAAVAHEQRLERGDERHEERDVLGVRRALELVGQPSGEPEGADGAAEALESLAWPVGRQFQQWRRGLELRDPVAQLALERLAPHHLPLPLGEVRVLQLELHQAAARDPDGTLRGSRGLPRTGSSPTSRRRRCDARSGAGRCARASTAAVVPEAVARRRGRRAPTPPRSRRSPRRVPAPRAAGRRDQSARPARATTARRSAPADLPGPRRRAQRLVPGTDPSSVRLTSPASVELSPITIGMLYAGVPG